MQHKCRMTVIDKKLYPELQRQYCADPESGACSCYNVGDEYVFERYGARDDFWHMGAGTLVKGAPGAAGSEGYAARSRGLGRSFAVHIHSAPGRQHHARLDE